MQFVIKLLQMQFLEKFQEDQLASKAKKVLRPDAKKVKPGKNAQKVCELLSVSLNWLAFYYQLMIMTISQKNGPTLLLH